VAPLAYSSQAPFSAGELLVVLAVGCVNAAAAAFHDVAAPVACNVATWMGYGSARSLQQLWLWQLVVVTELSLLLQRL
jgi:hypothetical protein